MKGKLRIESMWCFIVTDDDGTEGIPTYVGPTGMLMPLVAADVSRVEAYRPIIANDPMLKGKTITLAHFTVRHDVEVLRPDPPVTSQT